jgi:Putative transposase of IS4/5 family (DUF4096)
MWTPTNRGRMAKIEKKTKRYPSDLTDEEWERIASLLLPKPAKKGRRPAVNLREVLNAIRYMARSGGGWRMLPRDFPPLANGLLVVPPVCVRSFVPHYP